MKRTAFGGVHGCVVLAYTSDDTLRKFSGLDRLEGIGLVLRELVLQAAREFLDVEISSMP